MRTSRASDAGSARDTHGVADVPKGLHVYGAKQTKTEAWARLLILGPAKAGKTCCVAVTSPKPILVINCDGQSSLVGAANLGADYTAVDAESRKTWRRAVDFACSQAAAGQARTIVVDTISVLAENLLAEIKQIAEGYDLWATFKEELMAGIQTLRRQDAHLVVVAHPVPGEDSLVGILPSIPGKAGTHIPALLNDWVWFDLDAKVTPVQRSFLVGPQKSWSHGCRNARRTVAIDADVTELLKELGFKP